MNIFHNISKLSKIKKFCILILFILLFYYISPTNYTVFIIDPEVSDENKIRIGYSNQVITILPNGWENDNSKIDVVAFLDKSSLNVAPTNKKQYVEIITRGWFIRFRQTAKIRSDYIKKIIVYYNKDNTYNNIEYYPIT